MKSQTAKSKIFSTWSVMGMVAAVILSILAVNYSVRGRRQETRRITNTLPQVISEIRNLEVINATIQRLGEPDAFAAIEVRNNSDKAVIAIAVESGSDNDAYGVNRNGFNGDRQPVVVLEPHGTVVVEMELANLPPDLPIRVAGVIYADGTEDGDMATLGTMHRQREHERAKAFPTMGGVSQ